MEVIVAITILFALVTILFSNQQLSPPPVSNNLDEIGNNTLDLLKDNGELFNYLINANYSYYVLGLNIFDSNNQTKIKIHDTVRSAIPILADFKVYVYRYNPSTIEWDQLDIVNFESYTPAGSDITQTELYIPGFNGLFDQYRIKLSIWYEVQA
jgi:hypothetical protein